MSAKDFRWLAAALASTRPQNSQGHAESEYRQWLEDVAGITNACYETNNRFDHDTFFRACGAEDLIGGGM